MSQVVFTVSGNHVLMLPPERALLHLNVSHEGSATDRVYADTTNTHRRLSGLLGDLHDPAAGPITSWTSGQLRTWSHRPWTPDGRQLPVVHGAAVDVHARFSDFGQLSDVVAAVQGYSGIRVEQVEWALTEVTRARATTEARAAAVADALRKAQEYAAVLGLPGIRPIEIADQGMLRGILSRDVTARAMHAEAGVALDGPAVEFRPDDIEVSAGVDARFVSE